MSTVSSNFSRHGPEDSRDYQPIMASILIICTLGALSSIFPVLNLALSILVIVSILIALGTTANYFYTQYKLDQDALYGPLDSINEQEENNECTR